MNNIIKNIVRFVLFLLVQIIILNEVPPLHQFITPYIYFLFLLWLPFGTSRLSMTFIGFVLGYTLDLFSNTPGLHAAACTLVGYLRPTILNLLLAQEATEELNRAPSIGTMGWGTLFYLCLYLNIYTPFLFSFIGMVAVW